MLVDISKVKLLKGNSTSKTNRKWSLGSLADRSGLQVRMWIVSEFNLADLMKKESRF